MRYEENERLNSLVSAGKQKASAALSLLTSQLSGDSDSPGPRTSLKSPLAARTPEEASVFV